MKHLNRNSKESLLLHLSFVVTLSLFLCGFILLEPSELTEEIVNSKKIDAPDDVITVVNIAKEKIIKSRPVVPEINCFPVVEEEYDLMDNIIIDEIDIIIEKKIESVRAELLIPEIISFPHVQPVLIKKVKPIYPEIARLLSKEAKVLIKFVISEEGIPYDLEIIKGNSLFNESAIQAIKQYRYKAGLWNGQSVNVRMIIPIHYKLK